MNQKTKTALKEPKELMKEAIHFRDRNISVGICRFCGGEDWVTEHNICCDHYMNLIDYDNMTDEEIKNS